MHAEMVDKVSMMVPVELVEDLKTESNLLRRLIEPFAKVVNKLLKFF